MMRIKQILILLITFSIILIGYLIIMNSKLIPKIDIITNPIPIKYINHIHENHDLYWYDWEY